MTVRRISSLVLASVLLASVAGVSAEAATRRHTTHRTPHSTMHSTAGRRGPIARGGDAQNSTVDQLNQQSLDRARTGTPTQ